MRHFNHITKLAVSAVFVSALAMPAMALAADNGNMHSATQTSSASQMDSNQPVTDTWITTKVKSELLANHKTDGTDISVHTKNGVVTLTGTADSAMQKTKAVTIAKSVKGVLKVKSDDLTVTAKKY